MKLENIIKPYPLQNNKHDRLIKEVANLVTISPNVMTMFFNAYYKMNDRSKFSKKGIIESDIDYMALLFNSEEYDWARQSLKNWNSYNKLDKRPLEAIKAAEKWLENPSKENRVAAWSAARFAAAAESAMKIKLHNKLLKIIGVK